MRRLFLLHGEEDLFFDFPHQTVFPSEEKNIETVSENKSSLIQSQIKINAEHEIEPKLFQITRHTSVQIHILLQCKQNAVKCFMKSDEWNST